MVRTWAFLPVDSGNSHESIAADFSHPVSLDSGEVNQEMLQQGPLTPCPMSVTSQSVETEERVSMV